jgi:hypothetical protein
MSNIDPSKQFVRLGDAPAVLRELSERVAEETQQGPFWEDPEYVEAFEKYWDEFDQPDLSEFED